MLTKILGFIIGIPIMCICVIIPTLFFQPNDIIQDIEEDISIDLPDNYEVEEKWEDHLGFELHQEVTFKFDDENFRGIINQIDNNLVNENGKWVETENGYEMEVEEGFLGENHYDFKASINTEEQTLYYYYGSY